MLIRLKQAGDTIIEVMFALVIISSVIGGAYVSANRSTNANRQAQERGEALKLVEQQLERLKASNKNNAGNTNTYCLSATLTYTATDDNPANNVCKDTTKAAKYRTTIKRTGATSNYIITATWDRVGGGTDRQKLTMAYRVYP